MNSLNHLTLKQKQCIEATFSFLDTNNDEHLNQNETITLLRCLGQTGSTKDLLNKITQSKTKNEKKESSEDKQVSNEINIKTFLTLFQQHYTSPIDENLLSEAFQCFDTEFNGRLSFNELQYILTFPGTEPFTSDELNVLFTHLKTIYGKASTIQGLDTHDFTERLIFGPSHTTR
ncbi:calmodulin-2-like isoform X2 [Hylaeus volcanicus]|uniref:calmodulin-2-like isoform X2 n=1 Tax=Hylaeus volcanicus TaxID=313075 RepID=UPI0023B7F400|nr:calmodulin-2-like isoform X2 [Hylaeus volcanicus]